MRGGWLGWDRPWPLRRPVSLPRTFEHPKEQRFRVPHVWDQSKKNEGVWIFQCCAGPVRIWWPVWAAACCPICLGLTYGHVLGHQRLCTPGQIYIRKPCSSLTATFTPLIRWSTPAVCARQIGYLAPPENIFDSSELQRQAVVAKKATTVADCW